MWTFLHFVFGQFFIFVERQDPFKDILQNDDLQDNTKKNETHLNTTQQNVTKQNYIKQIDPLENESFFPYFNNYVTNA